MDFCEFCGKRAGYYDLRSKLYICRDCEMVGNIVKDYVDLDDDDVIIQE